MVLLFSQAIDFFTDKEKLDVGNPGDESERVHTTRFLTIVQFPIPSCR